MNSAAIWAQIGIHSVETAEMDAHFQPFLQSFCQWLERQAGGHYWVDSLGKDYDGDNRWPKGKMTQYLDAVCQSPYLEITSEEGKQAIRLTDAWFQGDQGGETEVPLEDDLGDQGSEMEELQGNLGVEGEDDSVTQICPTCLRSMPEATEVQAFPHVDTFWLHGGKKMQTWCPHPLISESVCYRAKLVRPSSLAAAPSTPRVLYPIVIYFAGHGHKSKDVMDMKWEDCAPEPFILVAPERPANMWWFIRGGGPYDWANGEYIPNVTEMYKHWIKALISGPGVDSNRVAILGFSAGAYAVTELLAQNLDYRIRGAGIAGVHGHGPLM